MLAQIVYQVTHRIFIVAKAVEMVPSDMVWLGYDHWPRDTPSVDVVAGHLE